MKYLCLAYGIQKEMESLSKSEFEALLVKCRMHDEELKKSGHLVSAQSLEWAAISIRRRNGKLVVTDGPFVEAREQIGGLVVIEAKDMNEAIRIASLHPAANLGERQGWGIEVRPIADGCHQ